MRLAIDCLCFFTHRPPIRHQLYGYVATTFGARDAALVEADIDVYYDTAYWRGAGGECKV